MKKIKDYNFLKTVNEKYGIQDTIYKYYADKYSGKKIVFTKKNIYIFLLKETRFKLGLKIDAGDSYKSRILNKNMDYLFDKIMNINALFDHNSMHNLSVKYEIFPDYYTEDRDYIIFKCNGKYKNLYNFRDCLELTYYKNMKDVFFKKILNIIDTDKIKDNLNELITFQTIKLDKKISNNDINLLLYDKESNNNNFTDELFLNFLDIKYIDCFCLTDNFNNLKIIALDDIVYLPIDITQTIELENI